MFPIHLNTGENHSRYSVANLLETLCRPTEFCHYRRSFVDDRTKKIILPMMLVYTSYWDTVYFGSTKCKLLSSHRGATPGA